MGLMYVPDIAAATGGLAPFGRSAEKSAESSEAGIEPTYGPRGEWESSLGGGDSLPRLFRPTFGSDSAEGRQRLTDDLVHVVVAVGCKAPDERHARRRIRQLLIFLVERLILLARHRVIGIALRTRIFIGDRRLRMLLPGQMLIFGNPGVRHVGRRIVHHGDGLVPFLVKRLMIELEAAVGQLAEAEIEIFVDRP